MCSTAAGSSPVTSTAACMASAIDEKKTTPRPRRAGRGTTDSTAPVTAARVPSDPVTRRLRSPGDRNASSKP